LEIKVARNIKCFITFIGLLKISTLCLLCSTHKGPYLTSVLKVAAWLQTTAIHTDIGTAWYADPNESTTLSTNLYSGSAGVVLFFLELFRSTNNKKYLAEAASGANYLLASLPGEISNPEQAGLYTGVAGIGFTLEEVYRATGEQKYRDAALQCIQLLKNSAKKVGSGAQWSNVTDIISGNAGIGLFLLYAGKEMDHPLAKELAIKAGRRLLQVAIPVKTGLKWAMDPEYPRLMPNFSHGTAGICYFLARLYVETDQKEFLEAALAGAKYLLSITNNEGFICHHQPGGEDLFYLGWCHGPVGTARLYYQLWRITDDAKWLNAIELSARGIMASGIPEQQTPGFWNNVSQCCGSAGIADFFLNLYRITKKDEYLIFVQKMTADLLARATVDENGMRWIQAEHRVRPGLLIVQTGYMQGAAGIGMFLLRLDALEQGKKPGITLPDEPF
jgi:lantibiotic modifying enzyme